MAGHHLQSLLLFIMLQTVSPALLGIFREGCLRECRWCDGSCRTYRKHTAGLRAFWFYRIKHGEDHQRIGVEGLVHHWCKCANKFALFGMKHREVYSSSADFACGLLPYETLVD